MVTIDEPPIFSSPTEEAASEKALGNAAYGRKDYTIALAHYTRAIELDPCVGTYFSNRAMCNITLERWQDAYDDCCSAMKLDINDCKIFMRRGKALEKLGRLTEAVRDFSSGLKLEPRNSQLIENHDRVTATINKHKKESPVHLIVDEVSEFSPIDFGFGVSRQSQPTEDTKPACVPELENAEADTNISAILRPEKKAKVGANAETKEEERLKSDAVPKVEVKEEQKPKIDSKQDEKPKVLQKSKTELDPSSTAKANPDEKGITKAAPELQTSVQVQTKQPLSSSDKRPSNKPSKVPPESDFTTKMILDQIIPDLHGAAHGSNPSQKVNSPVQSPQQIESAKLDVETAEAPNSKPSIPRDINYFMIKEKKQLPPKKKINEAFASLKVKKNASTSAEFESTCRFLAERNDFTLYAYIRLLPSSKYNTIFENGINHEVFNMILISMDEYANQEDAFTTLRSLASTKRFGITLGMISHKASSSLLSIIAQIHQAIGSAAKITPDSYNSLHQQYNVPKILDRLCAQ